MAWFSPEQVVIGGRGLPLLYQWNEMRNWDIKDGRWQNRHACWPQVSRIPWGVKQIRGDLRPEAVAWSGDNAQFVLEAPDKKAKIETRDIPAAPRLLQ
jgi:hypothetical protein